MKSKITIIISFFIIMQLFITTKSIANGPTVITNYQNAQKAIQEIAFSYYMRGTNIQYNTRKGNSSFYSPEDATSQNIAYMHCVAYLKNIYNELLGIKIPKATNELLKYSRKYIGNKEVIIYVDKNSTMKIYDPTEDNNYRIINNPSLDDIIPYLRVGDILTSTGHSVLIYEMIYDTYGNPIDAYVLQCGGASGRAYVKTKITDDINIGSSLSMGDSLTRLYHGKVENQTYGNGLIEGGLNLTLLSKRKAWTDINTSSKANEYSVLRFISDDENGNAILNYKGEEFEDTNHIDEPIDITEKSKNRIKYPNIYIEKSVNLYNNTMVDAEDELTYSIKIKNNSEYNYNDNIIVSENISNFTTFKNYEENEIIELFEKNLDQGKIQWVLRPLASGEETTIEYTLIVKNNCDGNTIESKGTVANIPSSIIKNKIDISLTKSQKDSIKNKYEDLKNLYNGKSLINEIYLEAMGVDLQFDSFNLTDLIKNNSIASTYATSIELNTDNPFYNNILSNYYNALGRKNYTYNTNNDITEYILKSWEPYGEDNRKADTICKENFKTGDILVYINENDIQYKYTNNSLSQTPITYENGEYSYIYIEGEGFVGINLGDDGISGTQDDRNEFNANYYKEKNLKLSSNSSESDIDVLDFMNMQTLFGKDYYVILRPTNTLNKTKKFNIDGTITSYKSETDDIKIQLYKNDEVELFEEISVKGNNTNYSFENIPVGEYLIKIIKNNHATREYSITLDNSDINLDVKICLIGDINEDGKVNGKDWNRLYEHINETNEITNYALICADINKDGKVNGKDWNRLYEHITEVNPL